MDPISPVLTDSYVDQEIVFAKNQPEYRPLPALMIDGGKVALTRWRLTQQEREAIAAGADITLAIYTFGRPLQPVLPEVFGLDSFSKQMDIYG